ncbi:FAD-dependent oxidoreductase [Shewanella hanedai]|uniref:FAD-binding oxidoreductase n=1 Tax=Shewanella hanedai TaxID=25 RepID=A0A553JRF3_SHEHA|nr:FAD-binding oxidoreductase [Shewanella hanedai]TRY15040.1 FAD-binding oxidoreductase [Shewanella hanedai]GGI75304.1 FAD-dependent oxidoreductase [Shewanella hanedai]
MTEKQFDPLISPDPANQDWPQSYWASTVNQPPANPLLQGHIQTDVVVIGGGYTGLLTAYYLATEFNVDVCVIEANTVGFGASGRNAGFVLKGSGRLGYSQMAKRWDLDTAKGIYHEFSQAVERVDALISSNNIQCDPQEKGYLKIAHNKQAMEQLKTASSFITQHLGGRAEFLTLEQLKLNYMDHKQAYGALRLDDGFGINPLKLVLGYKQMLENAKVKIFENSCILQWLEEGDKHRLITSHGEITANKVVCAGNAYTPKTFNYRTDEKYLPILSNIIVTEPLSTSELAESGLQTHQVTMDTRVLKYYYRLLPDNRLLLGGRGAITGKDAHNPIYANRLKYALGQCFPSLSNKSITYNWTGWIAAAMDDIPHVYEKDGVGYSLGYCGSGVAFSAQAGYRLAQSLVGQKTPDLPLYRQPLPTFPFARLRRVGQWGYYHYGWLKDKYG